MQVIVQPFLNKTQNEVMGNTDEVYNGSWNCVIVKAGAVSGGVGAVDAMMKKDLKAIVRAYERLIHKRGSRDFPAGKYEIVIWQGFYGDVAMKIGVTVK
jgi:hypothetical protein